MEFNNFHISKLMISMNLKSAFKSKGILNKIFNQKINRIRNF
jgi:hypothetical protein